MLETLKKLGVSPDRAAYVGDSEVDLETARNSGTDGYIVSWGFRTVEELRDSGVKELCRTAEELREKLL